MSWLTINGVEIPVKFPSATRMRYRHGAMDKRSFDGSSRHHHRTTKRIWKFVTVDMTEAAANQLEGFLTGLGYRFSFDTTIFDDGKGLGPNAGYSGDTSAAVKLLGARSQYVASGNKSIYATGIIGDYSILVHHYIASWKTWAVSYNSDTSTLTKYHTGAVSADTIGFLEWSAGTLTIHGKNDTGGADMAGSSANANVYYDELIVLPFQITAALHTAHYGTAGAGLAFGSLPKLAMAGDVVSTGAPINVHGKITGQRIVQGTGSDFLSRVFRFELHEV